MQREDYSKQGYIDNYRLQRERQEQILKQQLTTQGTGYRQTVPMSSRLPPMEYLRMHDPMAYQRYHQEMLQHQQQQQALLQQ